MGGSQPCTRLPRRAIGDAAIRVLGRPRWRHLDFVAYGEVYLLDEIAQEAGIGHLFALHRHKRVLDGLDRDPRFEKRLYRVLIGPGDREGMTRYFTLRAGQCTPETAT